MVCLLCVLIFVIQMTINNCVTLITCLEKRDGRGIINCRGDAKHTRFKEENEMAQEWKDGKQYNLDTPKEPLTQYYFDPMAKYPPPLQPLM